MTHKKFLGAASAALMIIIAITLVLAPAAWAQSKYKTLYKFKGGKDGVYPTGRLIFDRAGGFYGTTSNGGAHGLGTVFELTPARAEAGPRRCSTISRVATTEPIPIAGGVSFDPAGNLYGTTSYGGEYGGGTVYKLAPNSDGSWSESVLYSFGADGWGTNGPLSIDAAGNLYGVQFAGGSGACGFGLRVRLRVEPEFRRKLDREDDSQLQRQGRKQSRNRRDLRRSRESLWDDGYRRKVRGVGMWRHIQADPKFGRNLERERAV